MRTNLSSCLGLCYSAQGQGTDRLLIPVSHEGTHGAVCLIKKQSSGGEVRL